MSTVREETVWEDPCDLSGMIFKFARTSDELRAVYNCRAQGYGARYGGLNAEDWMDHYDEYATQCMCVDDSTNETLGVVRLILSTKGRMEVEDFLDIPLYFQDGLVPMEYTRFSIVTPKRRNSVRVGLLTLAYRYAVKSGITQQVLCSTEKMKTIYQMLLHSEYPGCPNSFLHPLFGNQEHVVMGLDLREAPRMYKECSHPFYNCIVEQNHANVLLEE